jgi:rhodanese-related sulfurtransferase
MADTTAKNLSAQQAWEFLSGHPDLQVLDVRTPGETARGMLPGARRISWGDPAFELELSGWDRSRPVLVYCQGGYRSRKAVEVLRSLGFNSVLHLHRGMMAWRWAGKAVTDGESRTTPSQ